MVVKNDGIDGQININDYLGDYRDCQYETTGCKRTGCVWCLMGIRQDLERIRRLQKDEPKMADYVLRGGEFGENRMWQPTKNGIGYWFILDWLALHGILVPYENADYYRKTYRNERTDELLSE